MCHVWTWALMVWRDVEKVSHGADGARRGLVVWLESLVTQMVVSRIVIASKLAMGL